MTDDRGSTGGLHVLHGERWRVGVLPGTGASLAFGQVHHAGGWHDLLRPTPPDGYGRRSDTASFVLVPWSNRVRAGRLRFAGATYRLRVNFGDGTAIHGTANEFPWTVESADDSSIDLTFRSTDVVGVNWPWRFSARVIYALEGDRLTIRTRVRNDDASPFPCGFGHHPYFQRTLTGPDDDVRLRVPCERMYVLDHALPAGPAVPVEPRVDFRALRPLGEAFVDDCLTGRSPGEPIELAYPSGLTVEVDADDVFAHVVVFLPVGKPFFAVEPVTNANDGFTLVERGVQGSGVFVLTPGEERAGDITLTARS